MGMMRVFEIAGSGLTAQRIRMEVTAANLVNAETTRTPEGGPFRPRNVTFRSTSGRSFSRELEHSLFSEPAGVQVVEISESDLPPILRYRPGHADADERGFVAYPNIDPIAQTVDLTSAVRSYQANVTVIRVAKAMAKAALSLLR